MIGLISYPLYLWHWPLLSFARIIDKHPTPSTRIGLILISFLLAWLTYRYVEIPVRRSREKTSVLVLVFSLMIIGGAGLSLSLAPVSLETRLADYVNEEAIKAIDDWAYPTGLISRIDLKESNSPVQYNANSAKNPKILLVGDSHMEQYSPRIVRLTKSGRAKPVLFMTCGGCPPVGLPIIKDVELFLSKNDSVEKIIMTGAWNGYLDQNPSEEFGTAKKYDYMGLRSTIEKLSERAEVIIVLDNPASNFFHPRNQLTIENRYKLTFQLSNFDIKAKSTNPKPFPPEKRQLEFNKQMAEVVIAAGGYVIDPTSTICPKNMCSAVDASGRYIYKDANHIRLFFVEENVEFLDKFVLKKIDI